jgi:uncharacterized protein YkwD
MVALPAINTAHAQGSHIVVYGPVIENAVGEEALKQIRLNSQVTISTILENTSPVSTPYVLIVEVRDKNDGITVFLDYDDSMLFRSNHDEVSMSWTPKERGEFYLRAFLISSWNEPSLLHPVVQSEILVGLTEVLAELPEEPIPPLSPEEQTKANLGNLTLAQLRQYALDIINADREGHGLRPVLLSDNPAAQKHAEDLYNTKHNSSHWTTDGMKPYMRYTFFGGEGAVSQNVHAGHIYAPEDIANCEAARAFCSIIDMTEMLELSNYAMMFDDEECCDNGHRDNILDPYHTHVSIGLAYDDYYFAYVQNFEANYMDLDIPVWESEGYVKMAGKLLTQSEPAYIGIYFDEYPTHAIYQRDKDRNSYDSGDPVAFILKPLEAGYRIAPGAEDYYVLEANKWTVREGSLNLEFALNQIVEKYGRGVYTIRLVAESDDGSTYTLTTYSIFKE